VVLPEPVVFPPGLVDEGDAANNVAPVGMLPIPAEADAPGPTNPSVSSWLTSPVKALAADRKLAKVFPVSGALMEATIPEAQ